MNQLAYLFHKTHNYVNRKSHKKEISYEENMKKFTTMSPNLWLHALIDYLLACAIYQIDRDTEIRAYKVRKIASEESGSFAYSNLLPIHRLVLFLVQSNILRSISHALVQQFVVEAQKLLLNPDLYNLTYLRRQKLPYLAYPFVTHLESVRDLVFPSAKNFKLQTRAKMLLSSKHRS